MNKRIAVLISSIANTFCDFSLDIAVNKFSLYKVLLYTSIISLFFQILYSLQVGVVFTPKSIPVILIYGFIMLLGYFCYVKALQKIPIGLAALMENLDLFIVLIIDAIIGYLVLTPKFIIWFIIFIISILWFAIESNKIKNSIQLKKIKMIGILFIMLSILFYATEPYLIKIASTLGANEVAINFGYSIFAIPFFYLKSRGKEIENKKMNQSGIILIIMIGLFESIYYIFGTIGYISETPIIVNIIQELRVFLLIILSFIFKTDKMNWKKVIAMILGMISIFMIGFR